MSGLILPPLRMGEHFHCEPVAGRITLPFEEVEVIVRCEGESDEWVVARAYSSIHAQIMEQVVKKLIRYGERNEDFYHTDSLAVVSARSDKLSRYQVLADWGGPVQTLYLDRSELHERVYFLPVVHRTVERPNAPSFLQWYLADIHYQYGKVERHPAADTGYCANFVVRFQIDVPKGKAFYRSH